MVEECQDIGLKLDSRTLLRIVQVIAVLVMIVLSLVIFASSMVKPVADAEQASCTAGVLLTKGKMIYKDFAHATQMPYYPFFCAAMFRASNTTHYLLAARVLTVVCDVLVAICIIGIFTRVFASFPIAGWLLGLAMAVLYVFNWHVDGANGFALSQDFVILCISLSLWLFISIESKRRWNYLRIGAMGALLTLASCMRFSAVFIQLIFFVMLLIRGAASGKERFKNALAFLIASLMILILPIWTAVQAPQAFSINVFEMPLLRRQLVLNHQLKTGATLYGKLAQIFACLIEPLGIFPFLIAICLVVFIALGFRRLDMSNFRNAVLAVLVPVIFLIIAVSAPEVLYENFAILIPFIIISFAYPLLYLRRAGISVPHKPFRIVSLVVIACTISQVTYQSYYPPYMLQRTSIIFKPQTWVPMKLHEVSKDVAENTKDPKLVVTLAPLYALEGGCNIYTELSAGWDGCKLASVMSASRREVTNTLNAETFKEMLEERRPSAIVIEGLPLFPVGRVILQIAKTKWPEQHYDKSMWKRIEYPPPSEPNLVAYFRL